MEETLFIPDLEPAVKHPTVFSKFDALAVGESFVLINDHDPVPLYYQMKAIRGNVFEWIREENGPEVWKVKIVKREPSDEEYNQEVQQALHDENVFVLNVTLLEPRLKHPTIFQHFDALKPGEAFQILNDHDPKPLYYQMLALRGKIFSWCYVEQGPDWWRVQIRRKYKEETVGELAAQDMRKAEVFRKYGIDFCCGGKKSLRKVCEEKGIDEQQLRAEFEAAKAPVVSVAHDFNRWNPDFLADYIYNQHHLFYYNERPVIVELMEKVAGRHGAQHPELETLASLVRQLTSELDSHFSKEEKVVFPYIRAAMQARTTGNYDALKSLPSLSEPVRVMEMEHEGAGEILEKMQQVTNGYTAPENACNSYQFLFKKLKALDEDLHQHIHLENNLLFPKALAIERELCKN